MSRTVRQTHGQSNSHKTELKRVDIDLLKMHPLYEIKKIYANTCHGVIASDYADWRTKANARPLVITRR